MKKTLKVILIIILIIALICGAAYLFLINKFSKMNYQDVREEVPETVADSTDTAQIPEPAEEPDFRKDEDVINILVVGIDNDWLPGMDDLGNADGLVIMSLNKNTQKIILSSILRDTLINIPDGGSDKATLVYHNHGLATLIDSIEYTFDIRLDNYVMVNYLNVINIIDAIGGIDVDVSAEEMDGINGKMENINYLVGDSIDMDMISTTGMQHLNGKQTAAYMRLRNDARNDFGRTGRIRFVISQLKEKLMDKGLIELNKFADVVLANINTDLSSKDMMSLLAAAPKYIKYDMDTNYIPHEDAYYGDGSYVYPDIEKCRESLHEVIYG